MSMRCPVLEINTHWEKYLECLKKQGYTKRADQIKLKLKSSKITYFTSFITNKYKLS